MTRSTIGDAMSCCPRSFSDTCRNASTSAGAPWASSAVSMIEASTAPERSAGGAGFSTTADPAASAARVDPAGIATGKFQGGATRVSAAGVNVAPSTSSSEDAHGAVEVREVDRLGHLGVGLVDGLAGLGRHDLDEGGAVRLECVADGVQHGATCATGQVPQTAPAAVARASAVSSAVAESTRASWTARTPSVDDGDPCGDGRRPRRGRRRPTGRCRGCCRSGRGRGGRRRRSGRRPGAMRAASTSGVASGTRDARKRSSSRANSGGEDTSEKTADMKLSCDAPSSRRRIR